MKNKIVIYLKKNSINLNFILLCVLLISSLLPKTYLPYILAAILGVFSFIYFRKNPVERQFIYFFIAIFIISIISWLYNFFVYKDIDLLGLVIWWLIDLFPFFIIILTHNNDLTYSYPFLIISKNIVNIIEFGFIIVLWEKYYLRYKIKLGF